MEADDILKNYTESYIYCDGFIKTKDYKTKMRILKSSASIFGLHILGKKDITITDADFIHYISITNNNSDEDSKITYKNFIKNLNDELKLNNFNGPLLELPKNSMGLNFSNEIFPYGEKINIRFNSFKNFYEGFNILKDKIELMVNI